MSLSELAFVWCSYWCRIDECRDWMDDNETFSMESVFQLLCDQPTQDVPLLSSFDSVSPIYTWTNVSDSLMPIKECTSAKLVLNSSSNSPRSALYTFLRRQNGIGLEVVIEATSDYPTEVRRLGSNVSYSIVDVSNGNFYI